MALYERSLHEWDMLCNLMGHDLYQFCNARLTCELFKDMFTENVAVFRLPAGAEIADFGVDRTAAGPGQSCPQFVVVGLRTRE